ncbi:MAG TPA: hypothetical protein VK604_08205 [Bryobacteraceae bacterium]|nr:hypothetical protein [Bryobacteraceae bacterium]
MGDDEWIEQENTKWRIRESGIGAELIRKSELDRLRPHITAFFAHGKIADVVALRAAFELADTATFTVRSAPVIESILQITGTAPQRLSGSANECGQLGAGGGGFLFRGIGSAPEDF